MPLLPVTPIAVALLLLTGCAATIDYTVTTCDGVAYGGGAVLNRSTSG